MANETDALLVRRCLGGDTSAFEKLLDCYKNQVFSLILRMVGNPQDAEDIAQETFIKAFRKLDTYDPSYPFITWLFRIAHNSCVDMLRARKPRSISLDDDDAPLEIADKSDSVEEAVGLKLEREQLERLLAELPPLYREALLLQYREGLSGREMASVLGIPEGTVKIRLFRAKALLRARLGALAGAGAEKR